MIARMLVWIALTLPVTVSAALPEMSLWRIGAQLNLVGNQDINQAAMEWNPAFGLEVGLEFEPWSVGASWRHRESDSESGNYRVQTSEERFMATGRRNWRGDANWLAWLQAGIGFQWFKVDMSLGGARASETSDSELVTGLGVGLGWPLDLNWRSELSGQIHKTQTRSAIEASASVSLVRLF